MDGSFYVIIMFLIFLKLMIWLCVFYARSRQRRLRQQQGIIIIQGERGMTGTDVDGIISREELPAVVTGGVVNPTMSPPSYEEVERTKSMEEKPPSYEQVLGGNYPSQNNNAFTANNEHATTTATPVSPPLYSETDSSTTSQG